MEVLYPRCAGLDVHKKTVVACVRIQQSAAVEQEAPTFETTTSGLLDFSAWLSEKGCTLAAREATGVYWKPVWHILADGEFELMLANGRACEERARSQNRRERCDVALRPGGSRSDPRQLRAGSSHPGAAGPASRSPAVGSRAPLPYSAAAEDIGGRRHQTRLGHLRHSGRRRAGSDRGDDRRPGRPGRLGQFGGPADQSHAGGAWLRRCGAA
jgi:hypothetical protein